MGSHFQPAVHPLQNLIKQIAAETIQDSLGALIGEELEARLPAIIRQAALPPYLDRKGLSDLTGWSVRKISYMQSHRQIPYVKRGASVLYPTAEIEEMLREGYVAAKR